MPEITNFTRKHVLLLVKLVTTWVERASVAVNCRVFNDPSFCDQFLFATIRTWYRQIQFPFEDAFTAFAFTKAAAVADTAGLIENLSRPTMPFAWSYSIESKRSKKHKKDYEKKWETSSGISISSTAQNKMFSPFVRIKIIKTCEFICFSVPCRGWSCFGWANRFMQVSNRDN